MIYPISLYNLGKVCQDSQMAGNILRALCKQKVDLTPAEQTLLAMIQNDNEWMNERVEAKRERAAERQRKARERKDGSEQNADVTQCHTQKCDKRDKGECHTQKCDNTPVTPPTYLPSSLPSYLPSYLQTNTNRSDTDTDKGVKGDAVRDLKSASGSDRLIKVNVYLLPDDVFFSGEYDVITLYRNACGDGFWAKARSQLGDAAMLEELNQFVHEVRAGESVNNPGAVMTKRLKAKGVK